MSDPITLSLIGMPEDVMRIILEKCDFVSIQCLRKTCHDLRNFIDDNNLKSSIDNIEIIYYPKQIVLTFETYDKAWELYPGKQIIRLKYRKFDGEPPKIIWERRDKPREKIIEDEEFTDAFSTEDFESILACKLPVLDQFSVLNKGYGLGTIRKALKSSVKTPIKVHTLFMMEATCVRNVLNVLPYMCPETVKCLDITFARGTYHTWNIKKMVKLEQWRNLKELETGRIPVRGAGIQCFEHFEAADICFEKVTMDDVMKVKEIFLNSPSTTKTLKLVAEDSFPEEDQLKECLGQPYDHPYKKKSWFFRRSDNNVLFIELYRRRFLECNIKTLGDVPEGAEVIG